MFSRFRTVVNFLTLFSVEWFVFFFSLCLFRGGLQVSNSRCFKKILVVWDSDIISVVCGQARVIVLCFPQWEKSASMVWAEGQLFPVRKC